METCVKALSLPYLSPILPVVNTRYTATVRSDKITFPTLKKMPALTRVRTPTATNALYRSFLLLVGLVLFLDGLVLLLSGKIHLGIGIPLVVGFILSSHAMFYAWFKRHLQQKPRLKKYCHAAWTIFGIWLLSFIVFAAILHHNIQHQMASDNVEAIIVLGSGTKHGQPSPALAKRLDSAAQVAKQHPNALIVLSGGVDFGEQESEAAIMSRYLQSRYGIPTASMLLEDRSTSTQLNLQHSKTLLQQQHIDINQPVMIVTSDFHTLRAAAIARKEGYAQPLMVAAPTPLSIRYNAWLREYFAFMSGWVLNEY